MSQGVSPQAAVFADDKEESPPGTAATTPTVIAILCLGLVAATVVFVSWPDIDLAIARLFVDADHRFWLAGHPVPVFFNELIDGLGAVWAVLATCGVLYTLARRRTLFSLGARAYAFLLASLIVAPGLIANVVFKNEWGRARPRQVAEFGGSADFTPALVVADQCASNCSFVAGDASLAFTTIALALLAPVRWRRRAIVAAIAFGAFIGLVRVVQGAHFASDVVFAGLFVALAVVILKAMIIDRRLGGAPLERLLAPPVRRLAAALAAMMQGALRAIPPPLRRGLAAVVTRRWWLRRLPGLRDFGLKDLGADGDRGS